MLQQKMPPVHPGEILKEMYLDPLTISITALADNLGVARKTVSQLVNGHMGVSAEMALRLGKAFNTTPELWLNLQRNYDLWQAGSKIKVTHIRSLRTSEIPHHLQQNDPPGQRIRAGRKRICRKIKRPIGLYIQEINST